MRKIESLFVFSSLVAITVAVSALIGISCIHRAGHDASATFPTTSYGAYLAAQHAVYVNDFERAAEFSDDITADYPIVRDTKYLSEFLGGKMPENIAELADSKNIPTRLIYDTYLIQNEKWGELYKRHNSDESALSAPLRIWSAVANDRITVTLKFIDKLPTNDSWKAFVRGQIYATRGKPDKAAAEFAKVRPEFLNINDYQYLMSFYNHHGMTADANTLRTDFTMRPGGVFMAEFNDVPAWETYDGYKNALAFSMVQNVSHTQVLMYSDLAILFLRMAQISAPEFTTGAGDTINYYIGQFFHNNHGKYDTFFNRVSTNSPFYLFASLRRAEDTGDIDTLRRAVDKYPLFVPGTNRLISHYISSGNRRAALRVIDRALDIDALGSIGRAYFFKCRAQVNYIFGDYAAAQSDIHTASKILPVDGEILALQAKIWAAEGREIENAYEYAMRLVTVNPTDINAWDTLGRVVAVREGVDAALDMLGRVGEIASTCSALFAQLGDLYVSVGDIDAARASYTRAIELSDDGLVIIPELKQKLRRLK